MAVRKVVTRSGGHSRGLMPSIKNPCASAWESQHELQFYRLLELSPVVRLYSVQPTREQILVNGVPEVYIPDVKVDFVNGTSAFFEVKPSLKCRTAHVAARLIAIRKHFLETDRRFGLITDDWLATEPRRTNVERLMYHRRDQLLSSMDRRRLCSVITANQPKTFAELANLVGLGNAWLLLGLAIVGVDLERSMVAESKIFIEGGHRHAHF